MKIPEIANHHAVVTETVRNYLGYAEEYVGYTAAQLDEERKRRLDEIEHTSALSLLAAIEAIFRLDYLWRCGKKKKDSLSRALRAIDKQRKQKKKKEYQVDIDDIWEAWKKEFSELSSLISELRGAFKYRHWLAHGRYWVPKLGRKYDYQYIFLLANGVLSCSQFTGAPL